MIIIPLQSGSSGNCIYVESDGVRLLFDAGISGIQAERRLAMHGRDIRSVDALIISHDHTDHISHAGVLHRKYGLPVHVSRRTYNTVAGSGKLGHIDEVIHFSPGDTLEFGPLSVETILTAHDAVDGSSFVIESGMQRLGIFTDLGHTFHGLPEIISTLDAVLIESNYDPLMLKRGEYPEYVKQRIMSDKGHLSNEESARLLRDHGRNLRWACLAHMSENNNDPDLAIRCHMDMIGHRFPLYAANRRECSAPLTL